MEFTIAADLPLPYDEAVTAVRAGLADAGFGVLTEIDIKATLKKKLDVDVEPKIILGACQPAFAHAALQADPRVAAIMPCNVVVSADGEARSHIEILDPATMEEFTGTAELGPIAATARQRLTEMLEKLVA
ncbi:MAG TPA: DUF302 domain-containing protein [Gordonia sp. (in: high G+C Gram-positive bacteria)]|uniref:DUF302 domain-containing protein n=1 Tax=unclassified Gordonia (in: high G+C Gram-positive bacteria) TaxID=2657482 RepID=UPI000FB02715|nr:MULTISPECIES: DUF302 domain-containing protein [unclassified Gordonia (in: high G+C Gram-positive bacteria)]RUP40049.1 MAG: DUF302 domain-containing protein [Gordonia sp. (in: high G+C Gram-positive bacteria)]HNP57156.1 DUF302 domain-containing protein [Gordonia sp. (in: high G+C Gram-positive bacteria)]HRC50524.1 DUF302 domain-containing protein [Gordonia sp. (in: high G+C Gram-positive bacteria)]